MGAKIDNRKCCGNCRICKYLQEDTLDGYSVTDQSSSYAYCKLGKEVNYLNIPMESTESKVFGVLRQLNTLVGYEIPKEQRVQELCKKADLGVVLSKKAYLYLIDNGYLKQSGSGRGVKYFLTKKIDVESNKVVNEIISYRGKSKVSKPKQIPSELREQAKPKQYFLGQKVFLISDNAIKQAVITGMNLKEDAELDNLNNANVYYTLCLEDRTVLVTTVYYFSDTIDGLCSLLKYIYAKSQQ